MKNEVKKVLIVQSHSNVKDLGIKITAGKFFSEVTKTHRPLRTTTRKMCHNRLTQRTYRAVGIPLGQRSTHPSGEKQHQSSGRFYLPVL